MATKSKLRLAVRHQLEPRDADPLPPLVSISCVKLFGKYSFPEFKIFGNDKTVPNVGLLYGENGVGKTTLLKLVYAVLGDEQDSGLKGLVANTVFLKLTLTFQDNQKVVVHRETAATGPFSITLEGPRDNGSFAFSTDPFGRVFINQNKGISDFIDRITALVPSLVFINDVRTIRSSNPLWNIIGLLDSAEDEGLGPGIRVNQHGRAVRVDAEYLASAGLERLLSQGQSQLRDKTIQMNAAANAGTGQIYASIAKSIFEKKSRNEGITEKNFADIARRIKDAQNYIKKFGEYTLLTGDQLGSLARYLKESSGDIKYQIYDLVEPYVISIERQIRQNRPIAEQIYAFEESVNSFLKRKTISFRVSSPARFTDGEGSDILVSNLSSGERHLVYMLTVAMLSRYDQAIVLIDEPELSLNYKWQRRLVETMLDISSRHTQFVMATHSFEIISSYTDSTVELEPA